VTPTSLGGLAARDLAGAELDEWDVRAVDAPGGHVFQSSAWAAHRARSGWRPRFLAAGDALALALVRPWPLPGGASAYLPRGPVGQGTPWTGDGSGARIGGALVSMTRLLAAGGVDVLAADPEVAASDEGYRRALADAGFHSIEEIQPSRHRMVIPLPADGDPAPVLGGVAKATRQRVRRAERDGAVVLRWDAAATDAEGLHRAVEPAEPALRRFFALLRETGDRRGFAFAGPEEFVAWWLRALTAGHLVYLEVRERAADGDVLGGLVLYRHGRRLSTAHSADRADRRHDHPGTMHLLRWRAIELAVAEHRSEMDLGGVDLAGARRPPLPGEPTFGLYEHKRSFGAHWVELAGAQERVIRPWRYAAGRTAARLRRAVRGGPATGPREAT
jgi:lipid II:glycine glycyltransferase (peptidoglycan interpeptide bridge formation enzyme)